MGGLASGGCDRPRSETAAAPCRPRRNRESTPALAAPNGPHRPAPARHRPDTRPAARRPGTSGPRHNARRPTFQHPACSNYTPARALGPPPDSRPPEMPHIRFRGRRPTLHRSPFPENSLRPTIGRPSAQAAPAPILPPAPHRPEHIPPSRDAPRPDFRKIFAECASI